MTEVMKKVRPETAPERDEFSADGPAAPAPVSGEQVSHRPSASGATASDRSSDGPGKSGRRTVPRVGVPRVSVGDPLSALLAPPAPPPVVIDPTTAEWDAARVDPAIIAFHECTSSICEQYRAVRARLLTMNRPGKRQAIIITSSVPQEGKSVTTLNLAIVMAGGREHSILIADADLRRSSIARMLGIDTHGPGLAELFGGQAALSDVIRPTPYPNVKLITAGGHHQRDYGELLGSSTARSAIDEMRHSFDYTFIDTPPVTTVSDVSLLAPNCDGAILVIKMRRTPEPTVQAALRTLQTNNVRIFGSLLVRYREERAGYYDRYYRYYRND